MCSDLWSECSLKWDIEFCKFCRRTCSQLHRFIRIFQGDVCSFSKDTRISRVLSWSLEKPESLLSGSGFVDTCFVSFVSFALISFSLMFFAFLKATSGGFGKISDSSWLLWIRGQCLLVNFFISLGLMYGLYVVAKTSGAFCTFCLVNESDYSVGRDQLSWLF